MKHFPISLTHGVAELEEPIPDLELFEDWMQERLSHVVDKFGGYGRVRVKPVDNLRVEVTTSFLVEAVSPLDVIDKFRDDFEIIQAIIRGIDITETKAFKLCFPIVNGKQMSGTFIRINPDSGQPMYTDD
jgi:hypothetical protein